MALMTSTASEEEQQTFLEIIRQAFKDGLMNEPIPYVGLTGLIGNKLTHVWFDEYRDKIPLNLNVVAKFEHPQVPDATITVHREGYDAHDPRNPNPQAGSRGSQRFILRCGEKQIGTPFAHVTPAKAKAQAMHEQMVERILALRADADLEEFVAKSANPLYGAY